MDNIYKLNKFIKFAYAVFENAAQWVREQKGE